jgi:hypothetical protein
MLLFSLLALLAMLREESQRGHIFGDPVHE